MSIQENLFVSGKGIRRVTRVPDFIIRLTGRRDARKYSNSLDVPNAYCNKLYSKCATFENREIITAEKILSAPRKRARTLISENRRLESIVNKSADEASEEFTDEGLSVSKQRAAHRKKKAAEEARKQISTNINELSALYSKTASINSALAQRIKATRNICAEKVNVYRRGYCSSGIDFTYKSTSESNPISDYENRNKGTDEAIKSEIDSNRAS